MLSPAPGPRQTLEPFIPVCLLQALSTGGSQDPGLPQGVPSLERQPSAQQLRPAAGERGCPEGQESISRWVFWVEELGHSLGSLQGAFPRTSSRLRPSGPTRGLTLVRVHMPPPTPNPRPVVSSGEVRGRRLQKALLASDAMNRSEGFGTAARLGAAGVDGDRSMAFEQTGSGQEAGNVRPGHALVGSGAPDGGGTRQAGSPARGPPRKQAA